MTHRKILLVLALAAVLAGCDGGLRSGDRVLVTKSDYELGLREPRRCDVVVFKYPDGPVDRNVPKNYIKRLWGLPGELFAIFFGRLYHRVPRPGEAPFYDDSKNPDPHFRIRKATHADEPEMVKLFNQGVDGKEGSFDILRKSPDVMMALRRIVNDNDHQAKDLIGKVSPRWNPAADSGWKTDSPTTFAHKGGEDKDIDWLRYQHLVRPANNVIGGNVKIEPQLITDVMGYNSYRLIEPQGIKDNTPAPHWVGDLMLECQLEVTEPKGAFVLEVSKGQHRFHAHFDLTSGTCTLFKLTGTDPAKTVKEKLGTSATTRVKAPGTYVVRLANIDARLTVWVDRDLPFDDGVSYPPPEVRGPGETQETLSDADLLKRRGPTENDLEPASVGSLGARVKISHIRLWRDTYYTTVPLATDHDRFIPEEDWGRARFENLRNQRFRVFFVQPGHYLVLGDNSEASADSRDWGLVPDRLMLGRALMVYFPFERAGPIR